MITPPLSDLLDLMQDSVAAGASPERAALKVASVFGFGKEVVHRLYDEYRRLAGQIMIAREPTSLRDRDTAAPWYTGPTPQHETWNRYLDHISADPEWSPADIEELDRSSTKIVSMLPQPGSRVKGRGLIVGYVQSGKTSNYTAVTAKSADVGYSIFVVLAGVYNALRKQTQQRLTTDLRTATANKWFVATELDHDYALSLSLNSILADHTAIRVLFVVKKNARILNRLIRSLGSVHGALLAKRSALIIDDEADHASINTRDPELKPSMINHQIMSLLGLFPTHCYLGYTATPFANVFVDPRNPEDLYPRHFITALPRPPSYFGAERIFGRSLLDHEEGDDSLDGLDIVRVVSDDEAEALGGKSTKGKVLPAAVPSGLESAVDYFLLATGARRSRGHLTAHSSMLVHTTMKIAVQAKHRKIIEAHLAIFKEGWRTGSPLLTQRLRALWKAEVDRLPPPSVGLTPVSYEAIESHISAVLDAVTVRLENHQSLDRLDYSEDGSVQIVVGGNVLSRGLTLKGLIVSYFLRSAGAYDTLLQMGRWFGFRRGYEDLPRIWTTAELASWFQDLALVEAEIRQDIERYQLEDLSPVEAGVRIRSHPRLAITSQLKMRNAKRCSISYSNTRQQTILFHHRDSGWLSANINAASRLVAASSREGTDQRHLRSNTVFYSVPARVIVSFLKDYTFHENSSELRADKLTQYIEQENNHDNLTRWSVAIIGTADSSRRAVLDLGSDVRAPLLVRSRHVVSATPYANLKAIMSKQDVHADLIEIPPAETPEYRPNGIPLLAIYAIDKDSAPRSSATGGVRRPLNAVEHLVGLGLVFPPSRSGVEVDYYVGDLGTVEAPSGSTEHEDG